MSFTVVSKRCAPADRPFKRHVHRFARVGAQFAVENIGIALNQGQRRFEFVRGDADEAALGLIEFFQLAARAFEFAGQIALHQIGKDARLIGQARLKDRIQ